MPFYRFLIHGSDPGAKPERGFYTTRHAFASSQQEAAEMVLAALGREFTTGSAARAWKSSPPALEVERGWRIGLVELFAAPNRGSTFYGLRG